MWEDFDGDQFFTCPLRFITPTHWLWFEEYQHYQRYPATAPGFDKMLARFSMFTEHFELCHGVYRRMAGGEQKTQDSINNFKKLVGRG